MMQQRVIVHSNFLDFTLSTAFRAECAKNLVCNFKAQHSGYLPILFVTPEKG